MQHCFPNQINSAVDKPGLSPNSWVTHWTTHGRKLGHPNHCLVAAWLYFSKLFMISYRCLTSIYYSRRTHEQDRLTSSSTELYVPLRTHINILFFLELYLNGICYTRTLLIPKPSTNLRVGSSHHPTHPCARPPPAWSWLPAFSWLRTASSSPPPLGSHTPPGGYTEYSSRQDKTSPNYFDLSFKDNFFSY